LKKKSLAITLIIFLLLGIGIYKNNSINKKILSLFKNRTEQADSNKTNIDDTRITDSTLPKEGPALKAEKPEENKKTTDNTKKSKTVAAVKQTKVQVKPKVIVIDAGHGGTVNSDKERISPDSNVMKLKYAYGATGIYTKVPEYKINLYVSLKLANYLHKAGYKVILTRTSNFQSISNIERAVIGNNNKADLVIRIHADGSSNHAVTGATTLVPGDRGYAKGISTVSRKYGTIIQKSLIDTVGMKNRGVVQRTDLTAFNWSKVPVVLVEMGFLSNENEDKLLSNSLYQDKIAKGLFYGINKVLK
jgi:N-acetylmuramoyl-L-alanine amidase